MDQEKRIGEIPPEKLPFYFTWPEAVCGEIAYAELLYSGVYYFRTKPIEKAPYGKEYYAIQKQAEMISKEARTYATVIPACPDVLLYECGLLRSGWEIIEYELEKYRLAHGGLPQENYTLHSAAIYGMELYPRYFGEFPVPFITPMGYTCRHKRIDNGIYWIETDQQKSCLAVCFPYCDEFSTTAEHFAVHMEEDLKKGKNQTLGYSFFPQRVCCIPLFELMQFRNWDSIIDKPAVMNAIWKDFPEYAAAYNANELTGRHDMIGIMQIYFGQQDVELHASSKLVISITPDAGTEFFKFL